jgi:hypothetical protein
LKTAIIEGDVIGGTCVNRGCVPSKALLAVSGRMRELQNEHHMKALGLQVIEDFHCSVLFFLFFFFSYLVQCGQIMLFYFVPGICE